MTIEQILGPDVTEPAAGIDVAIEAVAMLNQGGRPAAA